MKKKNITSKDWFKIGESAYFADTCTDYLIVRDQSPWKVYLRKAQMPLMITCPLEDGFDFAGIAGWVSTDIDGKRMERYMKSYARPETWEEVSEQFMATHEVHMMLDGQCLSSENKQPGLRKKNIGYMMHAFPENWHRSYQRACRLLRYLEKHAAHSVAKGNKQSYHH